MKSETLEEFLARGGKIEVIPPVKVAEEKTIPVNLSIYDINFMDLEEGSLYYAEKSKNNKNAKPLDKVKYDKEKINLSVLPDHLKKYL